MDDMNRLQSETSLYLQQHQDNPVDWWPWGDAALAAARDEDKPILLSIGYSACHWCHVMAHECFENAEIAALMNRLFINIKVDREERPDLDKIYQVAHQLIVQRPGGWPLTMFLTPKDQLPFFGGTYFPPDARQGMPAFTDVLQKVSDFYHQDPDEAHRQGGAVREVFAKLEPDQSAAPAIDDQPIRALRDVLEKHFDAEHGGFGNAPKFPQTASLLRLLNHWRASAHDAEPDLQALFISALSQTRMAQGGLMDQVGGGFFRYCVDRQWEIPHFEKMLYDNAQLLGLYAASWQTTGDPLFEATANATADWLLRDMRDADGGFYSTIDADSDGGEGAYYTWTPDEVRELLDADDYRLAEAWFGLTAGANFEGRWHLQASADTDNIAETFSLPDSQLRLRIDAIRERLRQGRGLRPAPGRDEKILTAWNAMTIKSLAQASRALSRPDLQQAATDCAHFLRQRLWHDNRLHASWQQGRAMLPAYLDDYALAADAVIELLQNEWRNEWLDWATALADVMLEQFEDGDAGGFFFTAHEHEKLMYRPKPIADDATPAGNAVAVRVLTRLGHLLGDSRYLQAAERTLAFAASAVAEYPQAHVSLIEAQAEYLSGTEAIILRGDAALIRQWRESAQRIYAPSRLVYAIDADDDGLPDAIAARKAPAEGALAYVCRGHQCLAAIDNWRDLASAIRRR